MLICSSVARSSSRFSCAMWCKSVEHEKSDTIVEPVWRDWLAPNGVSGQTPIICWTFGLQHRKNLWL